MKASPKREMRRLTKEKLIDYINIVNRNFWTLQGNWMVSIGERYSNQVALEFDDICFGRCAEVQVYRLKKFFNLGSDIPSLIRIFTFSQFWSTLDCEYDRVTDKQIIWRVTRCPMQLQRIKNGLGELPCKLSALSINEKIAKAINPKMKVACLLCPPDSHPENRWCEWLFELRK